MDAVREWMTHASMGELLLIAGAVYLLMGTLVVWFEGFVRATVREIIGH